MKTSRSSLSKHNECDRQTDRHTNTHTHTHTQTQQDCSRTHRPPASPLPVMSIAVPFQDGVFAGDPPVHCAPPRVRTVDVSMETVASAWVHDAASSYQGQENQHLSSYGGLCPQPEATIKLSPHLHRNKQLQDTLQQREEELARLQQENDKLRHFLSSSFVKNLEEKVKGLSSDHRSNLKRCLQQDHRTDQNLSSCRSHPAAQRISTRVCRNLFPEFCSDPGPPREPNLDLWVLQTLGLKDRDTIDPSASPNSFRLNPSSSSIRRLTPPHQPSSHFSAPSSYEPSAILPDLSQSLSSSSCDFVLTSRPDHPDLTTSTSLQHSHADSANANITATQHQDAYHPCYSPDQCNDITAHYSATTTDHYHTNTALPAPLIQGPKQPNTAVLAPPTKGPKHPNTAVLAPLTHGLGHSLGAEGITPGLPGLGSWSASGPDPPTHSHHSLQLSPVPTQALTSQTHTAPIPHPGAVPSFQMLTPPPTPRKDVVFRGSLSPSSSFKTHSFPQGQAFIRKDTQGCWSFTWIPKQNP
ncbi:geminin coiled-coil domain-containing protein 1 [Gadus morhua]|uniref:Geminin coiled-coil domain containing n=1 Tax=Gadus morhua TaxID=8049 RepID=A0A8C4ZZS5_GADMO|nr:geminin coiled-coil domain-containing protein 1 [Gadus morhua]